MVERRFETPQVAGSIPAPPVVEDARLVLSFFTGGSMLRDLWRLVVTLWICHLRPQWLVERRVCRLEVLEGVRPAPESWRACVRTWLSRMAVVGRRVVGKMGKVMEPFVCAVVAGPAGAAVGGAVGGWCERASRPTASQPGDLRYFEGARPEMVRCGRAVPAAFGRLLAVGEGRPRHP